MSLYSGHNVIIFGASGGIGRAFVDHIRHDAAHIMAISRSAYNPAFDNVHPFKCDITQEETVQKLAYNLKAHAPYPLIIIASGFLHDSKTQPEKTIRSVTADSLLKNLSINMIGPTLVMKHFLPLLPPKAPGMLAVLSARVGSITDNRLGGWYGYRASKAALNMMIKTAAIEQRRKAREHIILGLHPGTVDTALSKPFQNNIPERQLFNTEVAVQHMLNVINTAAPKDSGTVLAWDGQPIPG